MKQANKQLLIALVLAFAFCGAFAITSKRSQVASFLQAKTDFIPNRCNSSDSGETESTADDGLVISGAKYPACVCFWNGTCQFREDKTTSQWCNDEGAASVNEDERCPNLKGDLLYVCPQPVIMVDPIIARPIASPVTIGPMIPVEEAEKSAETPVATDPIVVGPIITAESVEESAETEAQTSTVTPIPFPPAQRNKGQIVSSQPMQPAKATRGCVCTEDGCTRQKVYDWSTTCEDDSVIAVVEDGACPKAAPCKLKAPASAYKCTKADRNAKKMCPMFMMMYGCVCYNDGTCVNQGSNSCSACKDDTVVSVTQGQQCDCI